MDFAKLGLDVDEIGSSIRWVAGRDLVDELAKDWGSHLHADLSGWAFPASYGDLMSMITAQRLLSVYRDPKKPVTALPTPWDGEEQFTPEVVAEYAAKLEKRSAFAD